jgi:diguanylate cyclase (GGDEF)-like protein
LWSAVPAAAILFAFVRLGQGGFNDWSKLSWWEAGAVAGLLLSVGASALGRLRRSALGAPQRFRADLELGGALVAMTYAIVALAGEPLYPIVYLLVACLVSFLPRASGFTLVGVALVFDGLVAAGAFAYHAAFMILFAATYHVVLSARLLMARKAEADAVKNRLREVEERARTFRLISSGTQDSFPGVQDQEKWLLAAVKEIEGAVGTALEIGEQALGAHTCAAFLLTADDRSLKLHDCRSASDRVQRDRLPANEGLLGGVVKRAAPLRMASASGVKVGHYEPGAPPIHALLAVPIVEGSGRVRGVVLADRLEHRPFTEADERLLCTLAAEVLRAIEVERVMTYIRKSRDEKDRFFRAIEELNRAGAPDQVFVAVLESARQLAGLDFCAVTVVSEEAGQRMHRVARIAGVTASGHALEGRTFPDNNGLVANVVRYGAPLPGREVRAMDRPLIFDEDTVIRGLGALKIFPLTAGDRILGTLVAGSRKRGSLDHDVLRMLEVLAIQAAQAVLRAQLYEQMERMATTDGLTGLYNHRTFQSKADEALAQARRYGRRCSLILTDIDHFKSVNDTYGHPVGDLVLKGVARIIREKAREADVVARYGGEEFAIVLPETDAQGAVAIAERIREAVKAEVFQTELGPIRVTLSLGVATFPESGQAKQVLIDLADQCLYHAKRHGRNQAVHADKLPGAAPARRAG